MTKTRRDQTLEEIWEIRRQIAAKLGRDPKKRAAYYQRNQRQLGESRFKRKRVAALPNAK